jgi:hypothetical protein
MAAVDIEWAGKKNPGDAPQILRQIGQLKKATIAYFSRWSVFRGSVNILPAPNRVVFRDHSSKTWARAKLFKPTYQIATGALSYEVLRCAPRR